MSNTAPSHSPLSGKHIVLGVTGGIAAYKAAVLVRLFVKAGAEVQVIMTPAAKEFITPLTLSTLSGKPVISEFFTANTGEWHSHVDLGLWADAFIVAPATASTLAKMACGVADNMLITSYLATRAHVFVAPAMDLDMMIHPSTVNNLSLLQSRGVTIIEPAEGELASHLVGRGRMEEPECILAKIEEWFSSSRDLAGRKVLVTAGPTYERIDPVRFIGNFSSGKMGYALANEAARRGAEVTLVSGPVAPIAVERGVAIVRVESAREMLAASQEAFADSDIAILAAAVADYRPDHELETKAKREDAARDISELLLVKNPDIAATLGKIKRPGQKTVGFALETDHELENASAKLRRKNLDMIVLNSLRDPGAGFGVDTNKVTMVFADGRDNICTGLHTKAEIATEIFNAIKGL